MAYKGVFKPKNPQKYNGDPTNIIYRSSWELKYMMYLDSHENVLSWSSEEVIVPYRSPIDNKVHRYFPDFVVKMNQDNPLQVF
jgi:trans-aconitate methyltransferase